MLLYLSILFYLEFISYFITLIVRSTQSIHGLQSVHEYSLAGTTLLMSFQVEKSMFTLKHRPISSLAFSQAQKPGDDTV